MEGTRGEHPAGAKTPPSITGDEPVEEALKKVMAHLGTPDRQAAVSHLARVCWAGPLERWLREPDVVDLEIGNGGVVVIRRADGALQVTEQKLSPEWIEFLVRLWRVNRGSDRVSDPLTASTSRLFRFTYVSARHSVPRPTLSVRTRQRAWTLDDLQAVGAFGAEAADFLVRLARSKANVLVSGGSGAGKTAVQEALLRATAKEERIMVVTMECEFLLAEHPRSVVWELSPDRPEVTMSDLVNQALKSQPDRIVVGEVRGGEAANWLYALNAGVGGGMVTVHANTPVEALDKILALARLGSDWPPRELARWLAAARPVVVQVGFEEKSRRVTEIGECVGFAERGGEVRFSVATLFDGRQLHYQAASDELLSRLPATQRRREA
ncbi:MAG TPA: ATPase, T2SS/T4P/T4SS family [Anaerolineae bacterium]|nr:ATPase, T2SS/T4P/T4SS family [Anaerolineae bacterium]